MRATTDSFKGDIAMQFVKFQAQKKELKSSFSRNQVLSDVGQVL
jgi:hypothetical protein